jgi:hypothetical protein
MILVEKRKDQITETDRNSKRKIEREEERLKATNRDLSMFKMKSMLAIGFAFTALLSTFSSMYVTIFVRIIERSKLGSGRD